MSINGLDITSPNSARYWSELKDLSNTEPVHHKKGWASRFAGTWKDSRSAEEIVRDIRSARTTNTFLLCTSNK